jgi:hypothetical protein
VAPNPAKAITSFSFASPAAAGTISEAAHTIAVIVPYGTNLNGLAPTIVHTGASISPASGTAQNFTSPVTYTVTAADGTTQAYQATVTLAPNPAKAITSFSFASPSASGTITESTHTIAVTVPYGSSRSALTPIIVHTGASVSPASGTAQNFTSPVTYTVTAADGTTQAYQVTVTVALNPAKAITSFSFASPSASGTITESTHTIAVTVPYDTNRNGLTPTIVHTGASISPASGAAQNFTSPVTYTVTAADGTTQAYQVTVSLAPSPAKAITSFAFASPAVSGIINESTHTIAVSVPYGTNRNGLTPTIAITGASISPASGTAQNFTSPVTYTVTAGNGTTQTYQVTVTAALASDKEITKFMFTNALNSAAGVSSDCTGTINASNIDITVPYGTNRSALIATFATTGVSVRVGVTTQVSGSTANNFSSPVTYTVTDANSATKTFLVTVTIAPNPAKSLDSFSFLTTYNAGLTANCTGVIGSNTVSITVPHGTNVTALRASFTFTGAGVFVGAVNGVGGATQASGNVSNNFTSPVTYTVKAADASWKDYVVTVTIAP